MTLDGRPGTAATAARIVDGLWRFGRPAGIAALILMLCFLTLYPMVMLLYGSLHSTPPGIAGRPSTSTATPASPRPRTCAVLANTVGISLVKTMLSLALAILLAWIIARTDTPGRGVLEVLITLPFFIPPILTATAWAMLGNAQVGTINLVWRWLTHSDGTLVDVYSYGGVDLAHDAVFDAVHLPVRRRRLPRHGSLARGIEPHVGRHALADLLAHHASP